MAKTSSFGNICDFFLRATMMIVTAVTLLYFYYLFNKVEIYIVLMLYLAAITGKGLAMIFSKKDESRNICKSKQG